MHIRTLRCELARPPKTNGKLLIGSVKPNIGHLESGAGVNGLIKLALAIHKGKIPAQIGFEKPNPRIPLDALNMEVPLDMVDFPEVDGKRRGIVNSFGFGGANASALLGSAEKKADAYSYACPCYANPKRGGLNFIFTVDLRSEDPPQKWILRGVALLASTA